MRKPIIFTVLSAMAIAAVSCANVPEEVKTSFQTVTLEKQSIVIPTTWSASLEGKSDVTVTPQTSGQLIQVCAYEGQHVKPGQVLFKIDSRDASAVVVTAKADLEAAKAHLSTAKLEYESCKNLFDKKIVSQYMVSTAENQYKTAQAVVMQAEASLARAQLDLSYCTITSPVEGFVGTIPNNPGDQVSIVTVLTTISGNNEMKAKFSITENALQTLTEMSPDVNNLIGHFPSVELTLKDGSKYPYQGSVKTISGVVDRTTGSVNCQAIFPNPDGRLYSGQQGTVTMPITETDVLVVPQTAIVRILDKMLVYKVGADSCAVGTVITAYDAKNGKDMVVETGLEEGDVIVALGASNVQEGQKVLFPSK